MAEQNHNRREWKQNSRQLDEWNKYNVLDTVVMGSLAPFKELALVARLFWLPNGSQMAPKWLLSYCHLWPHILALFGKYECFVLINAFAFSVFCANPYIYLILCIYSLTKAGILTFVWYFNQTFYFNTS